MDSSDIPLAQIVVLVILLVLNMILACYDAALQSVPDVFLDDRKEGGDSRAADIHAFKDHPDQLVHAGWLYLILSAVPAVFICLEYTLYRRWIAVICVLIAMYLFGRALPAILGKYYAKKICFSLYLPARFLSLAVYPVTWILSQISFLIVRVFGIRRSDLEEEVTEDEILSMVNEGHEQGVLDEHEAEMIRNVFELDEKEAKDIMTHRRNIAAISAQTSLHDAISYMVTEPNSRFPVYEDTIDNIIGILHFRDAMIFHHRNEYDSWLIRDIPDLLRPVRYIPETRGISLLFRNMQAQKLQMVIVVDEYGGTAGLVTMEDILEEIVGNILDEYDEEEKMILESEDGSWMMAGMTPLEDVEETLHIHFDADDYDTLNGYLVFRLDHIPEEGEHSVIEEQGFSFRIEEVESKTIRWVRVMRKSPEDETGENRQENKEIEDNNKE